jgi:hypothetical protein
MPVQNIPRVQATPPTVAAVIVPPKQISYQEAVALSTIGAVDDTTLTTAVDGTSVALATQLSPKLSLPVGVVVEGHTVTPHNSVSGGRATTSSDVAVMLDRSIQLAQGYTLPVGTVIQFAMTVADNGMIQASSKNIFINNMEVKVDKGVFYLTAQDSTALIADQRTLREGDLVAVDIKTGLWGAAGKVGEVLVQGGNTTSIQTGLGGTSTVQSNSSNPNILGAIMQGAFQPLTQAQIQRSNTVASQVQGLSKINTLPVNTKVRVFVASPGLIQLPLADVLLPAQPRFQAATPNPSTPNPSIPNPSTLNQPPVPEVVTPVNPDRTRPGSRTRMYSSQPFINRVAGLYGLSDSNNLG